MNQARAIVLHCAVLAFLNSAFAYGQSAVVVPNQFATVEGPTGNSAWTAPGAGVRWQQVHDASEFAAYGNGAVISSIAFRADIFQDQRPKPINLSIEHIEIRMSTTSVSPTSLSPVFDNNVGSDVTLVYSGPLSFSLTDSSPGGPKPWDYPIVFTQPFHYVPANGNLVLDFRRETEANVELNDFTFFDAQAGHDDPSQTPTKARVVYGRGADLVEGELQAVAVITRFGVPEPAGLTFSLVGFIATVTGARRLT